MDRALLKCNSHHSMELAPLAVLATSAGDQQLSKTLVWNYTAKQAGIRCGPDVGQRWEGGDQATARTSILVFEPTVE